MIANLASVSDNLIIYIVEKMEKVMVRNAYLLIHKPDKSLEQRPFVGSLTFHLYKIVIVFYEFNIKIRQNYGRSVFNSICNVPEAKHKSKVSILPLFCFVNYRDLCRKTTTAKLHFPSSEAEKSTCTSRSYLKTFRRLYISSCEMI